MKKVIKSSAKKSVKKMANGGKVKKVTPRKMQSGGSTSADSLVNKMLKMNSEDLGKMMSKPKEKPAREYPIYKEKDKDKSKPKYELPKVGKKPKIDYKQGGRVKK